MPQRNGTGPAGQGQMTGRGMGPCEGSDTSRVVNPGFGGGFGRGMGRGCPRQDCFGFPAQSLTPEQEKANLQQELEAIKTAEQNIQSRLEDLD